MGKIRHILVAVDDFPQNETALARAVKLAQAHKAKITIVHIVRAFGAHCPDMTERHLVEEQALTLARERVEDSIQAHAWVRS